MEEKVMPIISRERLKELVKKYPAPQSWYEEDWDEPQQTSVSMWKELITSRGLEIVGVLGRSDSYCNVFDSESAAFFAVRKLK